MSDVIDINKNKAEEAVIVPELDLQRTADLVKQCAVDLEAALNLTHDHPTVRVVLEIRGGMDQNTGNAIPFVVSCKVLNILEV